MAVEDITIIRVDTGEAVKNIADLQSNIKILKEALKDENATWEEQQIILKELQTNQAALRNAMHGTEATMGDIAKSAKGLGTSYNALVKRMADLTQEFRATEDAMRRADLAKEIKGINDQLKTMDAMRGNFQRNVGDYLAHDLKDIVKDLPSGLGAVKKGLDDTSKSLALMGKQPVLGIIALLAPAINAIVSALKDNETALDAVKKVLKALEPVAQFFEGILQKIAEGLAQAVDWVLELAADSGVSFKQIIGAATGVGNAVLQFILTPIRQTIDAAKGLGKVFQNLFKGDFKGALDEAKKAGNSITENFKKGISFKANFQAGQELGENFVAGIKSNKVKKQAQQAGKEVAEEAAKGMLMTWEDIRKRMESADRQREADAAETARILTEINQQLEDDINAIWDDYENQEDERRERERQRMEARKTLLFAYADTISSVFGSIADMLEADGEENEKAAKQAKALRTASAIIDTISGAIAAYMNGVKALPLPPGAGIALGVAQAATVLAAGMANIKKIQSTKVGSGGGESASVPALATAPAYAPAISMTRSVTGRSEVERLNKMASDSRVYLVYSDLEIANTRQRVRVQETEF